MRPTTGSRRTEPSRRSSIRYLSHSESVRNALGVQRLVKSFNHLGYHDLDLLSAQADGQGQQIAIGVAGDRAADRTIVSRLVRRVGFDPVELPTLAAGRSLESGTSCSGRPSPRTRCDGSSTDGTRAVPGEDRLQTLPRAFCIIGVMSVRPLLADAARGPRSRSHPPNPSETTPALSAERHRRDARTFLRPRLRRPARGDVGGDHRNLRARIHGGLRAGRRCDVTDGEKVVRVPPRGGDRRR